MFLHKPGWSGFFYLFYLSTVAFVLVCPLKMVCSSTDFRHLLLQAIYPVFIAMHQHKCVLAYLNTTPLQPSPVWSNRPGYSAFTPTRRGQIKCHRADGSKATVVFSIYPVITEDITTVGPSFMSEQSDQSTNTCMRWTY